MLCELSNCFCSLYHSVMCPAQLPSSIKFSTTDYEKPELQNVRFQDLLPLFLFKLYHFVFV